MQPQPITPRPIRAATYSRVSTFLQKSQGHSLGAQDDDTEACARRIGAEVVARYEDAESGAEWHLPGLDAMLDAARRSEFDVLIVNEPSRLARSVAKHAAIVAELRRYGVRVEWVKFQLEDTPEGRLLSNQLASFAEYERETTAFRTKRGRTAKAQKGLVVGNGPAPYGYRYVLGDEGKVRSLEPDPETAPILRRIVRDVASLSPAEVCRRLNAEGIPTPGTINLTRRKHAVQRVREDQRKRAPPTGQWIAATIRGMLANPVYTGSAIYLRRSDTPIAAAVPALITPDELEAARAGIQQRRTSQVLRRYARDDDPYVLRGVLWCPHCGGQLACLPNSGIRYYACVRAQPHRAKRINKATCSLPAARADSLEVLAWATVAETLLDVDRLREGLAALRAERESASTRVTERIAGVDAEITAQRGRLKNIAIALADVEAGTETADALRASMQTIEAKLASLRAARAELETIPLDGLSEEDALSLETFAAEIAAGIHEATPQEQRRIYQLLRLRGVVRVAADSEPGIRLGRRLRRFAVDWDAIYRPQNLLTISNVNSIPRLKFSIDSFSLFP